MQPGAELVEVAAGITHYVDAVSGNDDASGRNETASWKSLARASRLTPGPGDRLLFRAGQRWKGRLDGPVLPKLRRSDK
ncbi:hypothetical protein ACWCXX_25045 [Streptomyces sp. NPDC001732]